jgi:hypothetical protein
MRRDKIKANRAKRKRAEIKIVRYRCERKR